MIYLAIPGRFKPYVRMTRRSMHVDPQAQEYLSSKTRMGMLAKSAMARGEYEMLPGQTPMSVVITIQHERGFHNRDLDNEVKSILDGLQGIVFPDDRWVDAIDASRFRGDRDMVTVTIEAEGEGGS